MENIYNISMYIIREHWPHPKGCEREAGVTYSIDNVRRPNDSSGSSLYLKVKGFKAMAAALSSRVMKKRSSENKLICLWLLFTCGFPFDL